MACRGLQDFVNFASIANENPSELRRLLRPCQYSLVTIVIFLQWRAADFFH